jgi:hypothetical protein
MRKSVAALRAASLTAVAALTVALSVAACGSSTTATTTQAQASGAPQAGAAMGGPSTMFSSQLAALVTKGTITAAQQKSIVAALKSSMGSAVPGGGQDAQPSAGATPGAQMQGGPPDMSSLFTTALAPLVKAGTITQTQETAVIAALSTRPQGATTGAQPSAQPTSRSGSTTQI